jgi:hypothetical protein
MPPYATGGVEPPWWDTAIWPNLSASRLLTLVVLERDSEADTELGDLAVLDRHVLADDLGDPQLAHALAGCLDGSLSQRPWGL